MIRTARLRLRPWQEDDRPGFAALHADPEVMTDLGGPIDRAASDAKLDRYLAAFARNGFSRWAVTAPDGELLGARHSDGAHALPWTAGSRSLIAHEKSGRDARGPKMSMSASI